MQITLFLVLLFGFTWPWGYFVTPIGLSGGQWTFLAAFMPMVWAPTLIALGLTRYADGAAGLRCELRARLGYRGSVVLLVVAAITPVVVGLAAGAAARAVGDASPFIPSSQILPMLAIQVVTGSTGEELGWRGFLLPRLRAYVGETGAALLMSGLWALWHVPAFFTPGMPHRFMPMWSMLALIALFGVFMAILFRQGRQSVLPTMLAHISLNVVLASGGVNLASVVFWRVMAGGFGLIALVVISRLRWNDTDLASRRAVTSS
jgi:membrane protease YdiL (CAAX protease family)